MIYSILRQKQVPVSVERNIIYPDKKSDYEIIRYSVYDISERGKYIGYLDLEDCSNGVKVLYIKNKEPKLYKHFAEVADQIEVEHCLNRNIDKPYIFSIAAMDTHAQHFIRGKRFINKKINEYLGNLTKDLQKGEKVHTGYLGFEKMYMPLNMINRIKEKIKLNPLLKNIK